MIFIKTSKIHSLLNATRFIGLLLLPFGSVLIAEDAPVSLERIDGMVDFDAEEMNFRFRTKFNRKYVEDQGTRVIIARNVTEPPILNGVLEDPCWKAPGPQSEWKHRTQSAWVQMVSTDVTPKQTVLYVCYDDRNLYLAYVAEEPEPKSVLFIEKKSPGKEDSFEAYGGDCGEIFIETDGLGGDGYGWQFILNIYKHMLYEGTNPFTSKGITWDPGANLKGAMGPKRWIVEMAVPFKGFARDGYAYQGPPKRGERWGIRVVRNGRPPPTGQDRIFSTWTYNPVESWHNPWPTGVLIFDDPNLLQNGKFNEDLDNNNELDYWVSKKSRDNLEARLGFDAEAGFGSIDCKLTKAEDLFQVSQQVGVRPNKFYRLTGKLKIEKGQGKLTVAFDKPARQQEITQSGEWVDIDLEAYATGAQQTLNVYMLVQGGVEKILFDELTMVQEPFGIEKGMYCLTGNGFRPELNVRDKWKINGRYTYRKPGTDEFKPPYRKQWTPLIWNGYDDTGVNNAVDDWIPFEHGSLTKGGHNIVQWPWVAFRSLQSPTYPQGHEVILDLGRDFYVTGIDSLFAMAIKQLFLYVKPENSEDYILVDKLNGAGVLDPPGDTLYYRARGVNSVARYIKLHWHERTFQGGAQFFVQIWGTEKGDHKDLEVTRFQWKKGITIDKPQVPSFSRIREPFIVPQPQQVEWTNQPYVIDASTRIVCASVGYTPDIGRDFSDDTFEMQNVRLPVVLLEEELKSNPTLKNCIVIGDVSNSGATAQIAGSAGLKVTADDPGQQGYALKSGPERVLIVGSGEDQHGAFYGVTSVMQIIRRNADGQLVIPGCNIRDWPQAMMRDTMFRFSDGIRLSDEYKRIMKLYSMIRINGTTNNVVASPYSESETKVHEDIRDYVRRHFIHQGHLGAGDGGSGRFSGTEIGDDEDEGYLTEKTSCRRLNVCPSSSHGLYALKDPVDQSLFESLSDAEAASLDLDEMGHIKDGSRWLADRRCQRRGIDGPHLLYEYIVRFYDLCRQRGVKVEAIDCHLTPDAGGDRFYDMGKAEPYLPHDMVMGSWKGSIGQSYSNPELAVDQFERVFTWNNWGFNGNYGNPYAGPSPNFNQKTQNRIWGTRSSWWASSSNEGMVIGLLAKIVGGQCMGGNLQLPVESEYLWSPANPMPNTLEFANRMVNLTVRLNERFFGRPFPSWQEDRKQKWFKVDLRKTVNWSHIDETPADSKGWLDWGSNYDLRLLPMGDTKLEEVPFQIIDPKTNGGNSMIFLGNPPADAKVSSALPASTPEIPIGLKTASLCFLKARVEAGEPASYVATYEDGRQLTFNLDIRDTEVAATYTWERSHDFENLRYYGTSIGNPNPLARHIDFISRPGWLGYTTSGDECSVRIHEWVNPYPELTIRSITAYYPTAQKTGERSAIFAITGIEAEQQDFDRWARKERPPLRGPKSEISEILSRSVKTTLKPVFAGGKPKEQEFKSTNILGKETLNSYVDEEGNVLFSVSSEAYQGGRIFNDDTKSCWLKTISQDMTRWSVTVTLAKAATVEAIGLRGRFMTWKERGDVAAGTYRLARADYTIHVQTVDGNWHQVGESLAACGEDGTSYLPVASLSVQKIRVDTDVSRFAHTYYGPYNNPGFSYLQAYTK